MPSPWRVAVVGTSWWADGYHLPALRTRPDVELVALCGRNPARLAEVAARHAIPTTFTAYHQMLDQIQPGVVVVLTPNHLHHPMTLAAVQAGAHVICEKPLALNRQQAADMLRHTEFAGRRHLTFFTYRGLGCTQWIKQLINQGYLGRLLHLHASYLHTSWLDPQRPASWKTNRAQAGSGVLADLGSHVIDLLRWWFGEITRVSGLRQTFIRHRPGPGLQQIVVETDDATAFVAEFENQAHATVQLSRVAATRHNYLRIEMYGENGTLVLDYEQSNAHLGHVSGAQAGEKTTKPLPIPVDLSVGLDGQDTFPAVHARVTDGFFTNHAGYPTFADGAAVQNVIDAIANATESRRWEVVD